MSLAGKTALITGASSGIGAEVGRQLLASGARVVGVDCKPPQQPEIEYFEADVRSLPRADEILAEVHSRWNGPDLMVLSAGITADRILWKLSEEDWDRVIDINLKGVWAYLRAASPYLRSQGHGQVVVVSSINGLRGKLGQANYSASKAGCIALTRTAARELGPSGISVNSVAPGMVRTALTEKLPPEVLQKALAETLLGRLVEVEEVAAAIVYLLSPVARGITGTVLQVDAGQGAG